MECQAEVAGLRSGRLAAVRSAGLPLRVAAPILASCDAANPRAFPVAATPCRYGNGRAQMDEELRLRRRPPPPGQLGLKWEEAEDAGLTGAPNVFRSPEVEAAGDLMDAVRPLAGIAVCRHEMHEARHLDRITVVGERNDPGASAAHARVAARGSWAGCIGDPSCNSAI